MKNKKFIPLKNKYPPHIVDMLDNMDIKPLPDDSPLRNQDFINKLNRSK
jgi:hypothetical protein